MSVELIAGSDFCSAAVELAEHGWAVFPLRGKVPAIANPHGKGAFCGGDCGRAGHGVLDATTDVAQVEAWWGGPYRWANIGARVPVNAFVFDVDPRSGGHESLAALIETHGPLPPTLTCVSGRGDGGSHRYFRRPAGKLTDRLLGRGIDVKTSAGYCVVPPSIHPDTGGAYTWVDTDLPVAEPPAWLIHLIRPPAPVPAAGAWSSEHIAHIARDGSSIADAFTEATTWHHVLDPHGWRCLDPDGDRDGARWLHPAATSACSATVRHGCLFVWSTNTPFEPTEPSAPHGYTRFRAHAALNHDGDLSAAARALRTTGAF